ncbi:MAG TPA: alpha-amylase family glycosyl hydrolase [Alphaproteobacteria bacterium]|nr:alpha-amylase family glycosyl hydrolase [Alphaproteobacteria bacterium]
MQQRADRTKVRTKLEWWKRCAFYQIYPRSFQDSSGDGVGDLPGLIARVDYLAWLGIGAVWLSPVYPSPMLDFGYDISDYTGVDPRFGALGDLDRLIEALHAHDIRIILDVVPNHTSDQHPWFKESRSSRNSPKRDWYLWADPAPDGGPPNNWLSRFGGSAWELDERTGQYYYHAFLREQPDLNWHNPEVREAFAEVLRFWLRRGVDGFRIDASAVLAEDPLLRDDPPNPNFDERTPPPEKFTRVFTDARPETMSYLEEMRAVVDSFSDRVMLGEVQGGISRIGHFYHGDGRPRFHLPLNFLLLDTEWDVRSLTANIDQYLNAIPDDAWPVWILGSHDKPRIVDKIGDPQARVAAMLLFTLPGTPIFYAGDELGMPNAKIPAGRVRDPFEHLVPGYGLNRDPERAPMRWDAGAKAGFTSGEPWLPLAGTERHSVATQRGDSRSMLSLYRHLLSIRRSTPELVEGRFQPLRSQGDVLLFERCLEDRKLLVALNIGEREQTVRLPAHATVRLSTHLDRFDDAVKAELRLRAAEGVIVEPRAPQ